VFVWRLVFRDSRMGAYQDRRRRQAVISRGESANCRGTRLCEPQRVDGRVTWKLVPASVLLATRCGSQTHKH
jgi:hypothetical protein